MQKTLFDFARKGGSSVSKGGGAASTSSASTGLNAPSALLPAPPHLATPPPGEAPPPKAARVKLKRSRSPSSDRVVIVCDGDIESASDPGDSCRGVDGSGTVSGRDSRAAAAAASVTSSGSSSSRWLAGLLTSAEWRTFLAPITADSWQGGAFARIEKFLDAELAAGKTILPPRGDIFNAFNSCPFRELKVVLIGQDPYHDLHQAHGLCFSVLPGVPLPPSLRNMYKELTTDIAGFEAPRHGFLQSWSEQGMLLLNATLTVEAHKANSHSKTSGWPAFTDAVIAHLSRHHPNRLVFLLWGGYAQQKKKLIDTTRHVVLESVHPSPLSASRGWFGCHCFSRCNDALRALGHLPMYWQLPLHVHHGGEPLGRGEVR